MIGAGSSTSYPGGNQVDGLPPEPSNGSGDRLDLAPGSVTCLWDFDPKMYFYVKIADIVRELKTIFPITNYIKYLKNRSDKTWRRR